jgi:hypothetical protein
MDAVAANDGELVSQFGHWVAGSAAVRPLFATPVRCAEGADDLELGSPCDTPAKAAAGAQFCAALLSPTGAYARCAALVGPNTLKELYAACVVDHCGGGTVSACGSYKLLEDLCVAAGGAVAAGTSVIDSCGVCFGDGSSCGGSCTAAGMFNCHAQEHRKTTPHCTHAHTHTRTHTRTHAFAGPFNTRNNVILAYVWSLF